MRSEQHIETEIPVIEIDKGWPAEDVQTVEDCDDAFAFLMAAVAKIEMDIDLHDLNPSRAERGWKARASYALKMKRAALQIVQNRRGRILAELKSAKQASIDRRMLNFIRENMPEDAWKGMVQGFEAQDQ